MDTDTRLPDTEQDQKRDDGKTAIPVELMVLFRILRKQPANGHDFETCPICREHGITSV